MTKNKLESSSFHESVDWANHSGVAFVIPIDEGKRPWEFDLTFHYPSVLRSFWGMWDIKDSGGPLMTIKLTENHNSGAFHANRI